MPLFQPSNITPSSFAGVGGGTVAVADNVKITWQVNGNVAMTAYKIDIYSVDNKLIHTSGILINSNPFYPTDGKGNPQYFSYEPNSTWSDFGLTDGNEYNLQITQYWGGLTDNSHSVTQFSQSSFITRTKPTLEIVVNNSTDFMTSGISGVSQLFNAVYSQTQGDSIDWVRWKLRRENIVIDDTGIVNTQVLSYTADNLQSNNIYTIICTIQTENGVQITKESTFNVLYELSQLEGETNFHCIDKASNLLRWGALKENIGDDILGVSNDELYLFEDNQIILGENSNIYWDSKNNEPLVIEPNWSFFWKGSVNFASRYSRETEQLSTEKGLIGVVFNNDGTEFTAWGYNKVYRYTVLSGGRVSSSVVVTPDSSKIVTTVSYSSTGGRCLGGYWGARYEPSPNVTSTKLVDTVVSSSAFYKSPAYSAEILAIGLDGAVNLYRIKENSTVSAAGAKTFSNNGAIIVAFSPSGNHLIAAGTKSVEYLRQYSTTDGLEYSHVGTFINEGIDNGILVFSQDGRFLVCGTTVYSYADTPATITKNAIGNISSSATSCSFSPDGEYLYVSTFKSIEIYKTSENGLVYLGAISTSYYEGVACSPQGNLLVNVGGISRGYIQYNFAKNSNPATILSFGDNSVEYSNGLKFKLGNYEKTIFIGVDNELVLTLINEYTKTVSVSINSSRITVICNNETQTVNIDTDIYTQSQIQSVILIGPQCCEWMSIINGTIDITESFYPTWNNQTKFLTHFDVKTLQAGQLEVSKNTMDIYRENLTNGTFQKVYSCDSEITEIKDFAWIVGEKYNYYGYARLDNAYTNANAFTENPVCRNQPYYLLLATTQDEEQPNVYHVVHYWRFGNNIEAGGISNNNSPNFLENFTGYRLKQPTARKGKRGTLTALLSNVVNGEYKDTTLQMENLYALSECNNPLFLKDMKGNIYMVTVSGAITQTINTKSAYQEVKVSIPWEEIGSADDVSLIQIPTDEGWVDDNSQLAEVRLEVDEETGMLKVVYPYDYNYATTFGLVRPDLYATTKDGVEQADLELVNGAVILNGNSEE